MKANKLSLVNGILTGDKTQRLRGLVWEIYYQKTISPYVMGLTGAKDCSFGWLKGWVQKKLCFVKLLTTETVSDVDLVFSERMRSQGACVVFLRIVETGGYIQGYVCDFTKCSSFEATIGAHVANSATVFLTNFAKYTNAPGVLSGFFSALTKDELISVFSSRVIMNSGCIVGVSDLDAIYLAGDLRLVVVEFKRKYPAVKYLPFVKPVGSDADLSKILVSLKHPSPAAPPVFNCTHVVSPCFGLDLSHVDNFLFLSSADVEYIYMIVESSQKDPSKFFDVNFNGFNAVDVLFRRLKASDFIGVCETKGDHRESDGEIRAQSGSWNKGQRYQLVILQGLFSLKFTV